MCVCVGGVLTVVCALSRSHRRAQTSGSRSTHCTWCWPEIRRLARTGELLRSAWRSPERSRLPGLFASEGSPDRQEWTLKEKELKYKPKKSYSSCCLRISPMEVHSERVSPSSYADCCRQSSHCVRGSQENELTASKEGGILKMWRTGLEQLLSSPHE